MKTEAASALPLSLETNWIIAWGSLDGCVTVESSDHPIDDSDADSVCRRFPLALRPPASESEPCEIKVTFEEMCEVGQIYVRSTARAYEVYYSKSVGGSYEYLCTVRCGVAEREEEVLTVPGFSYVGEEEVSEEFSEESMADRDTSHNDEAWVNIKAPEVLGMKTGKMDRPQDLYEATAKISDSEPCSSLTIRFLLLQDKSQIFVDEVYIYVTPLGPLFPENGVHLAGSSTQSSLMSMLVPILQLSKSGANQIQDSHTSRILENGHMDTGSRILQDTSDGLEKDKKADEQNIHEKDKVDPPELQKPTVEHKCQEQMRNDEPALTLEQTLHQIICRFNRVEDVCLRLEGKLMNHIENVEARLQRIEDKLENLSTSPQYSSLPTGTRIVAPAFSFSDSNSSSMQSDHYHCNLTSEVENEIPFSNMPSGTILNPGSVYTAPGFSCGEDEGDRELTSDVEKETPCNNMPNGTSLNPGIVYTAPDFPGGEDEGDRNELNLVEASSIAESKKKVSVDDALAAALDSFLRGSRAQQSENNKDNSSLYSAKDTEKELHEHIKISAGLDEQLPNAQTANFSFKAPDFSDSVVDENYGHMENPLDIDSGTEDMNNGSCDLVVPHIQVKSSLSPPSLCVVNKEDLSPVVTSDMCATSVNLNGTGLDNEFSSRGTDRNAIDLAEDSKKNQVSQIQGEIYPDIISSNQNQDNNWILEDASEHESDALHHILQEYVTNKERGDNDALKFLESSCTSFLEFDFPILDVKFTSDENTSSNSVEDLLCGLPDSNSEIPSLNDRFGVDGFTQQAAMSVMDEHEYSDLLAIKDFLVDVEVSTEDKPSCMKGGESDEKCSLSSLQLYPGLV